MFNPAKKQKMVSQSLPNQVNDFNKEVGVIDAPWQKSVAIPSKPGQRLQWGRIGIILLILAWSQSLPNQVNDFNLKKVLPSSRQPCVVAIPSKPGQRLQ